MTVPRSNVGCCAGDHEHNSSLDNNHSHDHAHDSGDFNLKEKLAPLVIVIVLFSLGLIFEEKLHTTFYSVSTLR